MLARCIAYMDTGRVCGAPATIADPQRGGLVCLAHAPEDRRLRRLAVQAIATRPRLLLATALAEETDAILAAQFATDVATALHLRLCYPPRPDRWATDVGRLAQAPGEGVIPGRLSSARRS